MLFDCAGFTEHPTHLFPLPVDTVYLCLPALTAHDCLYMGKSSFQQGMYWRAVEWYDTALRLAEREHNRTTTTSVISRLAQKARNAVRNTV